MNKDSWRLARFFQKVNLPQDLADCWIWKGCKSESEDSYGFFRGGKTVLAHVFSYTAFIGPVPKGLELDHLCRVRLCVNPKHLEPVTRKENIERGINHVAGYAKREFCDKGHPFSGANLVYQTNGTRQCLTCRREYGREYMRNKRSKTKANQCATLSNSESED